MSEKAPSEPSSLFPIRVLLADDSEIMRGTIRRFLNEEPRIEIVGEASNFGETIQKTEELKPHLVLLDVHMRDESKFAPDFVRSKLQGAAGCVLAISLMMDEETVELSNGYGASKLVDKAKLVEELVPTIQKLCV